MTLLNSQQGKSLKAFVIALGQLEEPLPSGLQQQLHAIGQNIDNRVVELPTVAASLPNLNQAYQAALNDLNTAEGDQGATLVSSSDPGYDTSQRDRFVDILTAPDPVQAAQRNAPRLSGQQIASNPLKRLFGRG